MSALDVAEPGFPAPRSADALARRRAFSSPRVKRPCSPPLTRRRSVRSMKQLLPLSLPSNCYALPARERPLYIHGKMAATEPTMDECNFPELLVQDLDLSNLVFASKNMTAGPPSRNLAYDEKQWQIPTSSPQLPESPTLAQPIVRFKSIASTPLEPSEETQDRPASVSSSSSASSPSFSEVDPMSLRHQSVITNATTVTGGRNSAMSQKRRNSIGHDTNASWIDFDPEPENGDDDGSSIDEVCVPRRPATDLGMRDDEPETVRRQHLPRASTATGDRRLSNPFESFSKPASRTWSLQLHHQQLSGEGGRPLEPIEIVVPQRRSSLRNQLGGYSAGLTRDFAATKPEADAATCTQEVSEGSAVAHDEPDLDLDDLKDEMVPWFRYCAQSKEDVAAEKSLHIPRQRPRITTQQSPSDEVQTWLEDYRDTLPSEEQGRRMRLPPEVMETLRVSTACFPETMLLCSSLSVETIRSYSRKMRHPAPEAATRLHTPPPSPKRWKWSSVLGPRRSVSSLKHREAAAQRQTSEPKTSADSISAPMTPSGTPAQWPRLRNIFPHGSDYLLDALYAHLVAYAYVSSLCPPRQASQVPTSLETKRQTARPSSPVRSSSESPRKSKDSNDIPRKAATLLGLPNAAGNDASPAVQSPTATSPGAGAAAQPGRLVRKRSSFMEGLRASRMPPTAPADATSVRDLQANLARCIARIVATLRVNPAEADEIILLAEKDPKSADIDPLLVRTLCEIVRCCEEAG